MDELKHLLEAHPFAKDVALDTGAIGTAVAASSAAVSQLDAEWMSYIIVPIISIAVAFIREIIADRSAKRRREAATKELEQRLEQERIRREIERLSKEG